MRTEIFVITPAFAADCLTHNTKNRNLRKGVVRQLVDVIKQGKWELNGSAIRFGLDGRLLDGQHRLTAIVQAGIPCPSLVIYDLPDSTFETIDVGGAGVRTAGDFIGLDGVTSPIQKAAVGLILAKLDHCTQQNPTSTVALEYTRRFLPDIEWIFGLGNRRALSAPFRGACAWARKIDDVAVYEFAKSVLNNEVRQGTVAHAYVDMVNLQTKNKTLHSASDRHQFLLRTLRALEIHIKGETRSVLRADDTIMVRFKKARDTGKF